jgi:hypothetical protein
MPHAAEVDDSMSNTYMFLSENGEAESRVAPARSAVAVVMIFERPILVCFSVAYA